MRIRWSASGSEDSSIEQVQWQSTALMHPSDAQNDDRRITSRRTGVLLARHKLRIANNHVPRRKLLSPS